MGIDTPDVYADRLGAFHQGLKETGFVEGQNVSVEYRWAQGQYDRYPELAADLVRRQVAVIAATGGEPSPQSAKAATQTIPIVFTANGDPVREGLVASLNRPGGNGTGITIFGDVTVTKRLQLLHELVPQATTIAYLMNPNNLNSDMEMRAAQTAARSLGKKMPVLTASNEHEIDAAFASMAQQQAGALVVASDPFFYWRRDQLVLLAARHKVPAIYYLPGFARAGGLMAYGNSLTDMYCELAAFLLPLLRQPRKDAGFGDAQAQDSWRPHRGLAITSARQSEGGAYSLPLPNFLDSYRRAGDYVDKICAGPRQATCRSSSRPNLTSSSILPLPERSGLPFRNRSSPLPMR
jgi:putative tryptophan/tyrosine transport system substrate-binding protein